MWGNTSQSNFNLFFSVFISTAFLNSNIQGSLNKFPDFFHMGTFIDGTQLLEGPMEVLLCERVNDLHHSIFHLNCLIMTASKFFLLLKE